MARIVGDVGSTVPQGDVTPVVPTGFREDLEKRARGMAAWAARYTGLARSFGALPRATQPTAEEVAREFLSRVSRRGGGGFEPRIARTPSPTLPIPTPTGPTISDVLEKLTFPTQESLPPFLRDFGRYLEDLLTQQSLVAVPVPKVENGRLVVRGSTVETLEVPQDVEAYAKMWQTFLGMIRTANLALQEQLLGLRFSPTTGFFLSGQRPILPRPEHL